MWKLAIEDDQGNRTVVTLVRDDYSLGRADTNTVRLTERNVSRQHARIERSGDVWTVADLSSYNGIYVNGLRVHQEQALQAGDLLQLGDYRLSVVNESAEAALPMAVPGEAPTGVPQRADAMIDQDRLVMVVGPEPGVEFPLAGDLIVVGRGEECEVVVNHASVSRVHAEIQGLGDGRYEILDKGSANGVRINGVELQRSLLDARDSIELGDVVLKFIPAGQLYRPTQQERQELAVLEASVAPEAEAVEATAVGKRPMPLTAKLAAAAAGVGVLALVGVLVLRSSAGSPDATPAPAAAGSADSAARVLAEARELLEKGDIEGAHQKAVNEIPETSNARQSPEFRDIEARWADALFQQVHDETDQQVKRALLDQIARAKSVDSGRRKRAQNEIMALDSGGVDVTDLPRAGASEPVVDPSAKPRLTRTGGNYEATAAKQPPATSQGIIRSNPFAESGTDTDPKKSLQDMATSGDRDQLLKAKAAYAARVRAGTATDQDRKMLRGICRQLGDPSCSN